ncbi:MAG TPA: oxidoreductase [Armatimonadetes bacterium]|nr:oxidoreductase [Armatimonadota bacterium]
MNNEVRLGVIGLGGMGTHHANYVKNGKVSRCTLAAVSDLDEKRLEQFKDIARFTDSRELIRSGKVDAVLIATPHYFHTTIGIDAFKNGLHAMIEKPISVHKADCERLLAAHAKTDKVFGVMFNLRTISVYKKIKDLVSRGEIGEISRVTWIVTNWFRTESYYKSGGWRATWKGEGGGVLMNQCPHQLDILQWVCGMPVSLRAFCKFGAKHDIEVEDEVTAYMEFANGATGTFITSTGEAPGTNRLEIAGERGKLVLEDNKITFTRNEVEMTKFSRTAEGMSTPPVWNVQIPVEYSGGEHYLLTQNFVDAVLDGTPVIAGGSEGMNSVELANAMVYSTLINDTVELPIDGAKYEEALNNLIANSKFRK